MPDLTALRKQFEAWVTQPPFEREIDRWPHDETRHAWPGQYRSYPTELAWCAWQAASNQLEGGRVDRDAVIEECLRCYSPDDTATDWADKMRALKNKAGAV